MRGQRLGTRRGGRPLAAATAAILAALAVGAAGACSTAETGGGPQIVTGFYPLQFVAEQVGGDGVKVTNLAPPGAEPHDLELSPRQVASIAGADLVVYLAGFQPAVDQAVGQAADTPAVDAAAAVPLLPGRDPHLWLDPTRLAQVADAVADGLATVDDGEAAGYRERAAALRTRLGELDEELRAGLASCQRREIVTSHSAFGYLADRYDLIQIGISGLSPEVEPTPRRLAEITAEAKRHGATTIFFETLVSPRVAEAIADEVGATTAVLDPLEGLPQGSSGDYFSVMRTNLATLQTALGCS
jgi:zinc transport system substrate-binding protein